MRAWHTVWNAPVVYSSASAVTAGLVALALLGARQGAGARKDTHRGFTSALMTTVSTESGTSESDGEYVPSSSDAGDGASTTRKTTFSRRGDEAAKLTYGEVISLWQTDAGFRQTFIRSLAREKHVAFFWETPPLTEASLGQPFEHVVVDAPSLATAVGPARHCSPRHRITFELEHRGFRTRWATWEAM
jgi:hypothetical protein